MSLRIGIDVGGTNTDAVLMDDSRVVHFVKSLSTDDVHSGIIAGIGSLLSETNSAAADVTAVMIGTTQFTNAIVQRRGLARVGAVRLALPADTAIPIAAGWPKDLLEACDLRTWMLHGGHNFDGAQISGLDPDEISQLIDNVRCTKIDALAINGIFSTVEPSHEIQTARLLIEAMPGLRVSLGHEVGRIGALERENAAILNAALTPLAETVATAFENALEASGIDAPLFISQNDGTVMSASFARRYPIRTLSSGPTNSMRGAAFLSDISDAVVLDIGGTTSDAGVLVGGFPRQAPTELDLDGIRTNFRMPDVVSIGIGGGSLVDIESATPIVGPRSVGHHLEQDALLFGGDTVTASDVAVAAGLASFGDPSSVSALPVDRVAGAIGYWHDRVNDLIATVRGSDEPAPLILVGGGSFLIQPDQLQQVTEVHRPEYGEVANAVGAAIPQVSGEVERLLQEDPRATESSVLKELRAEAIRAAIAAGADPPSVQIVEEELTQLTQIGRASVRVRVRAVGDADIHEIRKLRPESVGAAEANKVTG